MNELMLLLMILTALALSAILADLEMWLEERKKKNVNTTRYVRFRSGVRSSNVRKEQLHPLFYEQKSYGGSYKLG